LSFDVDEETITQRFAERLGHPFARIEHLRDALTHRSFVHERPKLAPKDNERLEFLGDAVVGLAVAHLLSERFPEADEGELTRRRAELVREATLADLARELDVGPALRLGRGEELSGGREKPRLLASAFEACIGAVLLDAGPATALDITARLFESRLSAPGAGSGDFKSRIQELVQARKGPTPVYVVLDAEGPDHERSFRVAIRIGDDAIAEGIGRSKASAEQDAARKALESLTAEPK
jgi:ribonuclease-3